MRDTEKVGGIGDRVTFVHVEDDQVVTLTGTVVGLATEAGRLVVRIDGYEDWKAGDAVRLVGDGAERSLP